MNAKRYTKTKEEIQDSIVSSLESKGFSTHSGSICVLFSSIIAIAISECYTLLEKLHLNCFVSSADSEHLRIIANDLKIDVNKNDTDESIRYAITNHISFNNGCSKEAIKYAIMSSNLSIFDVKFKEFVRGAGSIEVYVFSKAISDEVLNVAKKSISTRIPAGADVIVSFPKVVGITLKITISLSSDTTLSNKLEIKSKITKNIEAALNSITEQGLSKQEIIGIIKSTDKTIVAAYITDFYSDLDSNITRLTSCVDNLYTLSNETLINI